MPDLENEDDLKSIIETGEEDGAAGHEEEGHEEQHEEQQRGVPVAVIRAMREQNKALKAELRELRDTVSRGFESRGGGGNGADHADPWKDLREMSDEELRDYADEGKEEASRVRKFRAVLEEEREERIAERTAKKLHGAQTSADLQAAQEAFTTLADSNEWLREPGALRNLASMTYDDLRKSGKSPQQALRGMLREVAPVLKAKGLSIRGLDKADPEFVQSITGGRAPQPRSTGGIDEMGIGRPGRGRDRVSPNTSTASNRTLEKAYADMTPDEREAWLQSEE